MFHGRQIGINRTLGCISLTDTRLTNSCSRPGGRRRNGSTTTRQTIGVVT